MRVGGGAGPYPAENRQRALAPQIGQFDGFDFWHSQRACAGEYMHDWPDCVAQSVSSVHWSRAVWQ